MTFIETLNSLFDFVDLISPSAFFNGIIGFMTVMFVWENYLTYRQYRVEVKNKNVPQELAKLIDQETFCKSRLYAIDKSIYSFFRSCFSQAESIGVLYLGVIPFLWHLAGSQLKWFSSEWLHGEIAHSNLFIFYFLVFSKVLEFPWSIYHTFVLEEKHGFNKQTFGFFVKDTIKQFIVIQIIIVPILSLLIYIVRAGGDYFFIYAWLFITVASLLLITVYADYIAPLFDRYTPLAEGDLRTQIEKLAQSLDFPLYKLYVVEGSKRSAHSNAYMYGFYKAKRIVLFDTLIEGYKPAIPEGQEKKEEEKAAEQAQAAQNHANHAHHGHHGHRGHHGHGHGHSHAGCNTEEILAVLAHELGHWKLSHNLKNLILSQVNTFLYFIIFAVLMNRQVLYDSFGFYNEKPVLIGLIIILQFLFAPYNELISFLMTVLGRHFEFQADAFAKAMGKTQHLKSSLVKLEKDNLTFPVSDSLYSAWHYSHPPLLERLKALDDPEDEKKVN